MYNDYNQREGERDEKGGKKWGGASRKAGGEFGGKVEERGIIGGEKRRGPTHSSITPVEATSSRWQQRSFFF